MDISQIKQKFIEEANTLLVKLDNILIELEKDPANIQYVNEAFRTMHTIKGAAGMFGFEPIVVLTHELESLYDTIRESRDQVPQRLIELTFTASDQIRALLIDEELADESNQKRNAFIKEKIEKLKTGLSSFKNKENLFEKSKDKTLDVIHKATWNILFYPNDKLIERAVNLIYTFQDLFALGKYKISNRPLQIDSDQFWSIFLVTDKPYDEIESALMFIMDYCNISKIAEFDIFDPSETEIIRQLSEKPLFETEVQSIVNEVHEEVNPVEIVSDPTLINEVITPVAQKFSNSHISVDSLKLDKLMYLVSELVTTKSELILAIQNKNEQKIIDVADNIEKLSKQFSENALNIRLVSLQEILNRFKRLIRDLSKQLGKEVNFITIGEETELDKNIIDNIGEPIMHLIRNCIDHGIEPPEKRLEKGKPATGIIKFEAEKLGNSVYINIGDDGNGIDTKYVYNKAVEKGFIPKDTELTHKETLDLIFLPGFSTAQNLTNVSGRGVGMDIVLKKIQEIRGEISITSNFGLGTTFTLKLQQTISIIETLLVKAGGYTYAIPMEDIETCILEPSQQLIDRQNKQIGFNDVLIPYINLRSKYCEDVVDHLQEFEKMIIINKLEKTYAIVADKIIGEYQAVVKPIGQAFKTLKFLSGVSILGDGTIALLLDTDKLWYEMN